MKRNNALSTTQRTLAKIEIYLEEKYKEITKKKSLDSFSTFP